MGLKRSFEIIGETKNGETLEEIGTHIMMEEHYNINTGNSNRILSNNDNYLSSIKGRRGEGTSTRQSSIYPSSDMMNSLLEKIPSDLLNIIVDFLCYDPRSLVLLASCSLSLRSEPCLAPSLRIRIIGCHGTSLKEWFYVSEIKRKERRYWVTKKENEEEIILKTSDKLVFGKSYRLWNIDDHNGIQQRLYLERLLRISCGDAPDMSPHYSHRFELGLCRYNSSLSSACKPEERQTWIIGIENDKIPRSNEQQQQIMHVPWKQAIPMTIGGGMKDHLSPHNEIRRVLTSRKGDWNVVVKWFNRDECTQLVRLEDFPTDGSVKGEEYPLNRFVHHPVFI